MRIPVGYCLCGCGEKTKIPQWDDKTSGNKKGVPRKYLKNHVAFKENEVAEVDEHTLAILLRGGEQALIDKSDWDIVRGYRWWADRRTHTIYVRSTVKSGGNVYLHRVILATKSSYVDHVNRNGLDNRRVNLRLATRDQNSYNTTTQDGCSSKFRGVSRYRDPRTKEYQNKWNARIQNDHIGLFRCEETAARAYDREASKRFGEFAVLNFPENLT